MRNLIRKLSSYPIIVASSVLALITAILSMIINLPRILAADFILIHGTGGFGYTVTTPDLIRRERPKQKIVIIYSYIPGTHNKDIKKLWVELHLIFIPVAFRKPFIRRVHPYDKNAKNVPLFQYSNRWRTFLFLLIQCYLRLFMGKNKIITDEEYWQTFPDCKLPKGRPHQERWVPAYFRLLKTVPASPVYLPQKERTIIEDAMGSFVGQKKRLCCLYLRLRSSTKYPETFLRSGGELESYCRAVRCLNEYGYRVLLVGDRSLSRELREEFGDMFIDSESLKISESLFYMYAATESDICIGECGGGFWLSSINSIPSLMINGYPFHIGWDNMVLYFKALASQSGTIIPSESIFENYGEEVVHKEVIVLENTAAELEAAVLHFIKSLNNPNESERIAKSTPGIQDHYWSVLANSYISPVWLELYNSSNQMQNTDRDIVAERLLKKLRG